MQLQFLGANRQVTGSRYLLNARGRRILVDCGLFQERAWQARNWEDWPFDPSSIDLLLLTHAHLDHCGLIPRLVRDGFKGRILATPPSIDLARIVMSDAARIQEEDAAYKKRRHRRERRRGRHPEVPLYTVADAERASTLFQPVQYGEAIELGEGIEVTYHDAGHILGSAMLEVRIPVDDHVRRLIFSGDIGQEDRPLMRDPHPLAQADYIVMESTYGDREHEPSHDVSQQIEELICAAAESGGNLLIPTFAIDRAQGLMYLISELAWSKRIPPVRVVMDSPMAIDATTVYKRYPNLLDDETHELFEAGRHPFQFPGLHFVHTSQQSRAVNTMRGTSVILAGSGMCTGGRIKHHLRNNIEKPETILLFAGYQAHGTLGRQILSGDPEVRIHGRYYEVNARIEQLQGLSAHADRSGLMAWLGAFEETPSRLFLTHGDEDAALALADRARKLLDWRVDVPEYGEVVELT